jgi:hypothetical protein
MAIRFLATCKLTSSEQSMLNSLLTKGESPCDGCSLATECDGPGSSQQMLDAALEDAGRCLLCGEKVGRQFEASLVPGTFKFCGSSNDEYVFTPRVPAQLAHQPPDDDSIF